MTETKAPTAPTTTFRAPSFDEWLRASTEASKVPPRVEAPVALRRAAQLLLAGGDDEE